MDNGNGIMPVMPVGGSGDFSGNAFIWIFGLLILMSMFNGGFVATVAEMLMLFRLT